MQILTNLVTVLVQSDWIFMKILSQIDPWTRKSLLKFGSNADPDQILLGRVTSMQCLNALVIIKMLIKVTLWKRRGC